MQLINDTYNSLEYNSIVNGNSNIIGFDLFRNKLIRLERGLSLFYPWEDPTPLIFYVNK